MAPEEPGMKKSRAEFVHRRNVANYTQLLREAPDAGRRKVLMSLLDEEAAAARVNGWLPFLD